MPLLGFSESIFSPGSQGGTTPSILPDGESEEYLQDPVPVNPSRRQGIKKAKPTVATSGPSFDASSPSADHRQFSENKSQANWAESGLPMCDSILNTSNAGADSIKICTRCELRLPKENFRRYWGRSSDGLRPICKKCQRQYEMSWRSSSKEQRAKTRKRRVEKEKSYRQIYDAINRGRLLVMQAKRRSQAKEIPCDLHNFIPEIEARVQRGVCELTGLSFNFHSKGTSWNSPSLDRIDPKKGYTHSNIRIVCFAMNAAMGNWGSDTLRMIMSVWLGRK